MVINRKDIILLASVFIFGFLLRFVFSPAEHIACDSFEVVTAAKTLTETGKYMIPEVGYSDLAVHYGFAGWPVGYALMLSFLFRIFGYSEQIAVIFTILISSLTIILTAMIARLFWDRKTSYLAAFLVAINPLLVAFNGRIFTNNPELSLLILAFTCLFIGTVKKNECLEFVEIHSFFKEHWRLVLVLLSFLFLGFLLTVRDTAAMFVFVYVYVFIKCRFFKTLCNKEDMWLAIKLLLYSVIVFLLAYSPSLYFNYQNFGKIITSTHAQWGGKLDFIYLLTGGGSQVSLPGGIIIVLTALVYCFPLIALFFIREFTSKERFFLTVLALMFLPILLVNGSYFTASSGASPRYMLPLIPFVSILVARSLLNFSTKRGFVFKTVVVFIIVCWLTLLTYPLPFLFKISPKFAYAAQYSPVYQIYPYKNYPLHSNAMAKWVRENTPDDAIIITHSRVYHFYYYSNRDVVFLSKATPELLKKNIDFRPIYYVEDHEATYNPSIMEEIKALIDDTNLELLEAGNVDLFSPVVGHTKMKVYKISRERVDND